MQKEDPTADTLSLRQSLSNTQPRRSSSGLHSSVQASACCTQPARTTHLRMVPNMPLASTTSCAAMASSGAATTSGHLATAAAVPLTTAQKAGHAAASWAALLA
jgi:hypothetical protein